MRHSKKIIVSVLCILMLATVFGCAGNGAAEPSAPDATTNGDGTQEAPEPGEPRNVRFMYWGSPVERAAIEAAVAAFEEAHPDITVEALHVPGDDFYTKLQAMIAGNEAPCISYSGAWKLTLGEDGFIYEFNELQQMFPDISLNMDGLVPYGEWKWAADKSAGPFQASVTPSLMYNVDIFEELGIDLPPTTVDTAWTWDEFVDVAMQLTLDSSGRNAHDPDFDPGDISQFGIRMGLWWGPYMPFVLSNGGNYLSECGTEFGLNQPEATEASQAIADLINVHRVHPTPAQAAGIPAPAAALQSGRIAMQICGSWNHADLAESGMNWGVGVLPKFGDAYKTFFHGGSLIIYKNAQDLEAAVLLNNWITDPTRVLDLHQGLWIPQFTEWFIDPVLIDMWASEELPGRPVGFQDAVMRSTFENAVLAPENGVRNFNEIDPLVSAALDEVWAGTKTAQQAMDEVAPIIEHLIDGWNFY